MIFRQTPKNREKYIIINNEKMIYELALLGIIPKYIDETSHYFVKNDKIQAYLKEKELEQWLN